MLIYSFITDYQAFNLRYKDNTTRDKNETKVGKQSANLGKNNEPIQNRLSFLMDCKSVILHHLTILSFPMVRPAWDNWRIAQDWPHERWQLLYHRTSAAVIWSDKYQYLPYSESSPYQQGKSGCEEPTFEDRCGASDGRKSSKRTVISNDFIIIHQWL